MKKLSFFASIAVAAALTLAPFSASAATTLVTPSSHEGWASYTQTGGTVEFTSNAIQLTTTADNNSYADYGYNANDFALSELTSFAYTTQTEAGPSYAASSAYIGYDANSDGITDGYFVYEPYSNGTVEMNTWQTWNVLAGKVWISGSLTCNGNDYQTGVDHLYSFADLITACGEELAVTEYGTFIGTYNPNYIVYVDSMTVNGTTYDFGAKVARDSDTCKNGGWKTLNTEFKNQGQCVSYFAKMK